MIDNADDFFRLLENYAVQVPLFVLYFVGLAFAIARYRRAPRAMLLVAAGLGWLAFERLVMTFVYVYVPVFLVAGNAAGPNLRWTFLALRLFDVMFGVIGIGLLTAGALAGRPVPEGYAEQTD